jgi:hypothetical protein
MLGSIDVACYMIYIIIIYELVKIRNNALIKLTSGSGLIFISFSVDVNGLIEWSLPLDSMDLMSSGSLTGLIFFDFVVVIFN